MNNKYSPEYRTQKKWTLWIFIALLSALLLNSLAGEYFKQTFFTLMAALTPVLIGFALTFMLKKLLDFLEQKVFKKWFSKLKNGAKINRMFCIFLLFVCLFALLYLVVALVVPSIVSFVTEISSNIDNFVTNLKTQLTNFFESTGWFNDVDVENMITDLINRIGDALKTNIPLIANSISSIIQQTAIVLMYLLTGVIISIIMLYRKEEISAFSKRLTYATFSEKKANKIVKTAKLADKILYDYVGAKCIEALIVFVIMLPGLYIFKVPYPLVMALVMAIINIIPYIGSLIAGIIIAMFTIASSGVLMALWITIYTIVVLNLYGSCVSPFLFGKRMNVSSLLIIISMLVFGSIFGLWGIILGAPAIAVIWILLNDYIAEKENEKLELERYNLTVEDINDLEVLEEAKKIVELKRIEKQAEANKNVQTKQQSQYKIDESTKNNLNTEKEQPKQDLVSITNSLDQTNTSQKKSNKSANKKRKNNN